jgi:hypothetical protein
MHNARRFAVISVALVVASVGFAFAQTSPSQPMIDQAHHPRETPMAGHADARAVPKLLGQDAFGAIQEIVQMLEADPKTDWSRVDLEALRQHLIDMNEVTLRADASAKQIEGGLEIAVTGTGRALLAIQRMVPAWSETMNGYKGWTTKVAALPNGELLTVTSTDPKQIQHIRGLGFIGLLVSGSHHQMHHLMMAKGELSQH